MAKDNRKEYAVDLGGVEHTFLLTPEDAEKYPNAKAGDAKRVATEASQAQAEANRAAQAAARGETLEDTKEGSAQNKSQTPANK